MIFQPGQTIVRRHLYPDGRVGSVLCGRVVSDDERGLALWIEAGSQAMRRVDAAGRPTRHLSLRTSMRMTTMLTLSTWEPYRTLMVMPPGAAHSVWWGWRRDGGFARWYVNLERPITRWAGGVDVCDQELDLLVYPDGTWSWKDEDAFAEYTGDPAFWDEAEAAEVRAEGERLLALARRGAAPFDGRWLDFRPDPAWPPTSMPHWWELPADATCWGPEYFQPRQEGGKVMDQRDEEFLRRAIALAAAAPAAGGRPFGSLLVGPDGAVLAEAHNTVPGDGDITAHPELKLARWAARELDAETVAGTTMYTSCEPCDMCGYAIDRAGLRRVVFALSAEQFHALSRTTDAKRVPRDGPALFDEARAPIDAFFA